MNTKLTAATILQRGETEGVTSYQIATLINEKLAVAGVKAIRPQMMYNYSVKGMIVKGVKGDMSHRYTVEQAVKFASEFANKRISKNVPEVTTPKDTAAMQSGTRG